MFNAIYNWFIENDITLQSHIYNFFVNNPGCRHSTLKAYFLPIKEDYLNKQINHLIKKKLVIKGTNDDPKYLISNVSVIEVPPHFRTLKVVSLTDLDGIQETHRMYVYLPYTQFWFLAHKLYVTHSLTPNSEACDLYNNFFYTNVNYTSLDSVLGSPICLGEFALTVELRKSQEIVDYFWNSTFNFNDTLILLEKLTKDQGHKLYTDRKHYRDLLERG